MSLLIISLIFSNCLMRFGVKFQAISFFSSSRSVAVSSESLGMNLARYTAIPRNRWRSALHVGLGNLTIARTFSRHGDIISAKIRCPRKITLSTPILHFALFSLSPALRVFSNTLMVLSRSSSFVAPQMMMSSLLLRVPSQSSVFSYVLLEYFIGTVDSK